MEELLKNCNTELFKVGDKVRIRRDIKDLAELKKVDIDRYTRIFPNEIQESQKSRYKISYGMVVSAGKTAEVTEIIPSQSGAPLLSTLYVLKINESYSEWLWKHALLEKVEEEKSDSSGSTRFPLKVGDIVTVRHDIAERRDKSGYIWSTVNGQKIKSPLVTRSMVRMAGESGKITSIYSEGEYTAYTLAFSDTTYNGFLWSISCLEEFHDYKAYVEGNSGKKKAPQKKSEERGEDCYRFSYSRETIDDSEGLKTDFFFAYDYKGRKRAFPDIEGFITKIDVTIISGDETGLVYFVKDGKASRVAFDASVGTRFISYDDGTYTVEGKDNIKKWLSWSYDKDKAKNVNYAIQHMTDFLGGDK
nr:MAG TPA: mindbomb E3 ubiquitin protein ligase [Bacteriophage sp.]